MDQNASRFSAEMFVAGFRWHGFTEFSEIIRPLKSAEKKPENWFVRRSNFNLLRINHSSADESSA